MEPEKLCVMAENNEIRKQCNITVMITELSNERNTKCKDIKPLTREREFSKLLFRCDISKICINFLRGNKIHRRFIFSMNVYVDFNLKEEFLYFKPCLLLCFVSVIDNDGNKRFTRTFSEDFDTNALSVKRVGISISEYISLQTVLSNPHEFLQNDTLTLDLDITFVLQLLLEEPNNKNSELNNLITLSHADIPIDNRFSAYKPGVHWCKLFLNSEVSRTLREVSKFFFNKFIHFDPSEALRIRKSDFLILKEIFKILKGMDYILIEREYDVRHMEEFLKVAKNYEISNITEACQQFITGFLNFEELPSYLRRHSSFFDMLILLARHCSDTYFIEMVKGFVESNKQDIRWGKTLRFKWTYQTSLGFQLSLIPEEIDRDNEISYFN